MRRIKAGRARQMPLPIAAAKTWGGARKGAGRKPHGRPAQRPAMPHVTRPNVDPRFPVQVTIRATRGLLSLRSPHVFGALRPAIARASVDRFRVIHFSVQQDHATSSSRGMMHAGLAAACTGWRFEWHLPSTGSFDGKGRSSAIGTTRDPRRHRARRGRAWSTCFSTSASTSARPRASIRGARGRIFRVAGQPAATDIAPATVEPGTWMARVGWRLAGGPLRVDELPAATQRPPNLNRRISKRAGAPKGPSAALPGCRGAARVSMLSRDAERSTGLTRR